jgi:hypothetical protein
VTSFSLPFTEIEYLISTGVISYDFEADLSNYPDDITWTTLISVFGASIHRDQTSFNQCVDKGEAVCLMVLDGVLSLSAALISDDIELEFLI